MRGRHMEPDLLSYYKTYQNKTNCQGKTDCRQQRNCVLLFFKSPKQQSASQLHLPGACAAHRRCYDYPAKSIYITHKEEHIMGKDVKETIHQYERELAGSDGNFSVEELLQLLDLSGWDRSLLAVNALRYGYMKGFEAAEARGRRRP